MRKLTAFVTVLTLAASPALAMPGGGGGGSATPSVSAPSYDPAAEYAKGVEALQASRFKDATRAFRRVTAAQPDSAEAWRGLGQSSAGEADWKGSRRAYERAVKLSPDDVAAHAGLGVALAHLKDAKAQGELDWIKAKAQACGDSCADAAALKAAAEQVQGALSGAPSAALAEPMIFAGAASGDAAYSTALGLVNEHRYDAALASLHAAEAVFGPHPDILTMQGYAWRKKGDYARAESYYRRALAIAPDHRGASEYYGELKVERGDLAGARTLLAKLDRVCAYGCAEAEELRRWIDHGGDPRQP
jgi:Flp pilus assembly protein TadD